MGGDGRQSDLRLDKVARFFGALAEKGWSKAEILGSASIGGLPGQLSIEADGMLHAMAVGSDGGRITAIQVMRNPDSLGHLGRDGLASGA